MVTGDKQSFVLPSRDSRHEYEPITSVPISYNSEAMQLASQAIRRFRAISAAEPSTGSEPALVSTSHLH